MYCAVHYMAQAITTGSAQVLCDTTQPIIELFRHMDQEENSDEIKDAMRKATNAAVDRAVAYDRLRVLKAEVESILASPSQKFRDDELQKMQQQLQTTKEWLGVHKFAASTDELVAERKMIEDVISPILNRIYTEEENRHKSMQARARSVSYTHLTLPTKA